MGILAARQRLVAALEERMDDIRAVLDAAGSQRAAVMGVSDGGPMAALFAATYPQRTQALILHGAFSRAGAHLMSSEELQARLAAIEREWPESIDPSVPAPTAAGDESYRNWFRAYIRNAASPGAAIALLRMNSQIDIRHVLPTIDVPRNLSSRVRHQGHRITEATIQPVT